MTTPIGSKVGLIIVLWPAVIQSKQQYQNLIKFIPTISFPSQRQIQQSQKQTHSRRAECVCLCVCLCSGMCSTHLFIFANQHTYNDRTNIHSSDILKILSLQSLKWLCKTILEQWLDLNASTCQNAVSCSLSILVECVSTCNKLY